MLGDRVDADVVAGTHGAPSLDDVDDLGEGAHAAATERMQELAELVVFAPGTRTHPVLVLGRALLQFLERCKGHGHHGMQRFLDERVELGACGLEQPERRRQNLRIDRTSGCGCACRVHGVQDGVLRLLRTCRQRCS